MGIDPARLGGPIVGIASTWTGTMPCNLNQRQLTDRTSEAIADAGGVPLPFNTTAVSDNQAQGTPGMRASLISREVIADSIELMVHAHDFDAVVCLVGCDKTVPAALMALARVDKPAVLLYSGPMRAGRVRGADVTIQHVWETLGAFERGAATREELDELEREACPGPGTCAGHFTANTMAVALDCLGISRVGDGLIAAEAMDEKAAAAKRAGELAVSLAKTGPSARAFLDRRARLNAMAGIAATGGSTNGLVHLLAISREAGNALTLGELVAVAAQTPVIASLAPSGRWVAENLQSAGGTATVIAELIRAGLLDGEAPTVDGITLAEATSGAATPDGEVLFTTARPFKPAGRLTALRGFEVWVAGRSAGTTPKTELAEACGAWYVSVAQTPLAAVAEETGAFDVAIEAAGDEQVMLDTLGLLRRNGVACLLGVDGRSRRVELDGSTLGVDTILQNRALLGSVNAHARDWEDAVDRLDRARERWPDALERFVGLRVPVDRFEEAFEFGGVKATLRF
jgi:hypothetical protein